MKQIKAIVKEVSQLQQNIFLLKIEAPYIAANSNPGQFCNIRVSDSTAPLLRRPFSISDVENDEVTFMINTLGEGTKILKHKIPGEELDVIGPLGNGFNLEGEFQTAVIVAGGLGAAPFPFFFRRLSQEKRVLTFVGGRTSNDIITHGVTNISISTDDGSLGFKGTVIELIEENKDILKSAGSLKIFGCGPTPMLRALKAFALRNELPCEVSTECAMACGFGICQGCPIEATDKEGYYLVCKDGPVFDARKVVL